MDDENSDSDIGFYGSLGVNNIYKDSIYYVYLKENHNTFKDGEDIIIMTDSRRGPVVLVILIFVIILSLRFYVVFAQPNMTYDSFFTLRQSQNILKSGIPLYNDPLSYGGKTHLFAPLHYYTIAFGGIFMPLDVSAKIIPNIFAALMVVVVYLLALKLTKSQKISLIASLMSGLIPIYFYDANSASSVYLTVLLTFSAVYCIFRISERKYMDYALIFIFLLVLTTPLSFLLVIGLLIYLLLSKMENMTLEMKELEIILFFTFLSSWVNLLIYKNAFLKHGLLVIWQNIPQSVLSSYFASVTFLTSIYAISIIPLLIGVYAIYINFIREKIREVMILVGLTISNFVLLWFKLISFELGMIMVSMSLVILSAYGLKRLSLFIEKTKISHLEKTFGYILVILILITSGIPSYIILDSQSKNTPNSDDLKVLDWASKNLPKDATILSTLQEGDMVTYYANRKDVIDKNFLLTFNIDQRLDEVDTVYKSFFETEAVGIMNKYKAEYILFTNNTAEYFGISEPSYIKDYDCFIPVFRSGFARIYDVRCKLG